MPERDNDPIASTQMFRAFVQGGEAEAASSGRPRVLLLIALLVAAAALAAGVVVWLLAG